MADVGSAIVAPTLGTLFCIGMWLSPLRAVLEVRRTKKLGALNPLPFGITVVNCIAWVMYSCQKRDFFIFFANGSGLVLGFFYCLSIFPYLKCDENATVEEKQMKMRVEVLVVGGVAFWAMIAMIVFIILDPTQTKDVTTGQTVVSSFAVITTLSYYASPLTTMAEVIKIKDSSSLYAPMILMNLATAFLWYASFSVCVRLRVCACACACLWYLSVCGCACRAMHVHAVTAPCPHHISELSSRNHPATTTVTHCHYRCPYCHCLTRRFIYGLIGKPDVMIWVPNGIGCLLAISQLLLYFTFHPVPLRVRVQKAVKNLDVLGLGFGSGSGLGSGLGSGSGQDSVKGRVGPTGWATEAGSKKDKLSRREEDGGGDGDGDVGGVEVGGVEVGGVEMGWDDHHVTASAPVTVTVRTAGPVPPPVSPSVSPPVSPSVRPQPGAAVRPDTSPETSPESSV